MENIIEQMIDHSDIEWNELDDAPGVVLKIRTPDETYSYIWCEDATEETFNYIPKEVLLQQRLGWMLCGEPDDFGDIIDIDDFADEIQDLMSEQQAEAESSFEENQRRDEEERLIDFISELEYLTNEEIIEIVKESLAEVAE